MAKEILQGYGDASRGEWMEIRTIAFHLRRRLSEAEQLRVGGALDCRNSDEAQFRLDALKPLLSPAALEIAKLELRA